MKVIVSNKIRVKKANLPRKLIHRIEHDLSFENPDWLYFQRTGNQMAMKYTPRYVTGYVTHGNVLHMDRSYLSTLLKYLKNLRVPVTLVNKVIEKETDYFDNCDPISLRGYQKKAIKKLLVHEDGIIVLPCGSGKTRILIETARRLRQSVLVFVHTTDLLNQWKQNVEELLGVECGIIQGDKVDIKPITIAMVQTLSQRVLTKKFLKMWGCLMVDEAHHTPANTFTELINQFPAKHRYGATATVFRSDRLEGLLFSVCGFPRYKITFSRLEQLGYIVKPSVRIVETNYINPRSSKNYVKAVGTLVQNTDRQRLVVSTVLANQEHYNLVLSSRVEHLEVMYEQYRLQDDRCALFIGRVKSAERQDIIDRLRAGEIHTIFATQLADEGLDIPILDRVYLTTSTKAFGRIEQRIGRIQRPFAGKEDAVVYDFKDSFIPMFNRHANDRLRLYASLELTVDGGGRTFEAQKGRSSIARMGRRNKKIAGFKGRIASYTYR